MKKLLSYSWLLLLLFSLGACSIQEEIHFNKDFSGSLTRSLDFSRMMQMAKSMNPEGDTVENPLKEATPEEISPEMDIEGIRNFKMEVNEEGAINLSFDFDNLDALNKAYNKLKLENMKNMPGLEGMGDGGGFTPGELPEETETEEKDTDPEPDHIYFAKKGKNFYYYPTKTDPEENTEMESNGMNLDAIGEMLRIETKFIFDRKIKKISNNSTQIETFTDNTDNLLRLRMKLEGTQKNNKQPEIKIRLK